MSTSPQRPPVDDALDLLHRAMAIVTAYGRDPDYVPCAEEWALWLCLRDRLWQHQAAVEHWCERLEKRR